MRYKAYTEILDLPFFYQMQDLIVRSTENTSQIRKKKTLFGKKPPKQTMDEQYGLRYPDEVLERYQERCGDGRTFLRAFAGKDIYLSGALYALSEKESERERLWEILLGHPFCSTQEVFFVLSVFCGEHSAWERLYPTLAVFLGKERTI